MFSKQNRLTTKDFNEVFKIGKNFSNDYFLCKYIKSDKLAVSVAVSKKVFKKAVKRNLVKRRVASILREKKEGLSKGKYIFVVKKNLLEMNKKQLEGLIFDILSKVV